MKKILRSLGAVIGGSVAIGVTAFVAGYVLGTIAPEVFQNGRTSNPAILMFILAYSITFSGLGGYVTAWLAGSARMNHVIALAILQLIAGIAASTQTAGALPGWFVVAVVVLPVPAILLGGSLRSRTS